MKKKCIGCEEELTDVGVLMDDYLSNDYSTVYVCEHPNCNRYSLLTFVIKS